MRGLGSIGPPSDHILSFHDWQARLSASLISASPRSRSSAERSAKTVVMARDFASSLPRALRMPPEIGGSWCFGAMVDHRAPIRSAQAAGAVHDVKQRALAKAPVYPPCVAFRKPTGATTDERGRSFARR